jgi:hypothetical protein
MRKWPIFLFILITIFSCGKTTQDEIDDAVLQANLALGQSNCQGAIDILELLGRQNKNAKYLKALASAYACRAGYSALTFFATDLALTTTPAPFGGSTKYTLSLLTYQNPLEYDPKFVDLQTAINILLYAGGIASTTEPTATERAKYFTTAELGDMHTELMFLEMVQIGIFMKVYGNANAAGVKGNAVANSCFSDYPSVNASVNTEIGLLGGTCDDKSSVHISSQLASTVSAAVRKRRLCHGVVLLNGFFDSLNAVVASATGSISNMGGVAQAAQTAGTTALTAAVPSIGIVKTTINQTLCEDNALVPVADIESYFAIMYESMLQ